MSAARSADRQFEAIVDMQKTLAEGNKTLCLSFAQLVKFYRILRCCNADRKHVAPFLETTKNIIT